MHRPLRTIATLLLAGTAGWQAQAAHSAYSFSHSNPGCQAQITGSLMGSLQADGNTIIVSAVLGVPSFNGAPAVAVPFVDSLIDVVAEADFGPALVSLDGRRMDFAACTHAACDDGSASAGRGLFGYPLVDTLASFGNIEAGPCSPSQWSISAMPEAGTWLRMGLGLAGIAAARRRA